MGSSKGTGSSGGTFKAYPPGSRLSRMADPATALLVRTLHVLAMAALLGGAALLAVVAARTRGPAWLDAARGYEALFWGAAGLLVLTGVGNLGAYGDALPPPGSPWGGAFLAKVAAVLLLLPLSMVRTLAVALAGARPELSEGGALRLAAAYAATALLAGGIVVLAVGLAHG